MTDVTLVLEQAQPTVEDVEGVRSAVSLQADARKRVADLIASLPAEPPTGDVKVALRKGLALWAIGRETEAAAWLEGSKNKVASHFRALALISTGRPGQALDVLGGADDTPAAQFAQAEAYANLGDVENCTKLLAQVKKADAGRGAYLTARIAELDGDRAAARSAYREALESDPQNAIALFHWARLEFTYGDEDEAVELYRRCLDCPCPPLNAYLNLGNVYEDRGEFTKARDCYKSVLRADGAHQRAAMFDTDARASLDMFYDEDMERRADKRSQVLRLPVTDFELSVRSRNCLAKMGVRTLGDLIQRGESELLSYKNFGETSLQEIKDILAQKGLRLGMGTDEVGSADAARSILEGIGGDADNQAMEKSLAELELSVRSRHCMNVLGLKSVGDLVHRSEAELMTIKNFGQTSLNEVKQKLAELGLTLKSGAK